MRRIPTYLVLPSLALGCMLAFLCPSGHTQDLDTLQERLFKVQLFLAKGGDRAGQYYLAEMYEKGLGTPQDLKEALAWYKKSAELGHTKAMEKLANWEKTRMEALKTKERAEIEARAADIAREKHLAETAAKAQAEAVKAAENAKARQQAEIEAAKAKQMAEMEAIKAAEIAQARQQAEAKIKAAQVSKPPTEPAPVKVYEPPATLVHAPDKGEQDTNKVEFTANPCKGPQAKFLSTCQ